MKLYMENDRFFIDNFGFISSFGLALFVERDMVSLHDWDLVRCPGKSICEIPCEVKVIVHVIM